MILIKDKPGQLCNRMWAFSPFIQYALENNCKLIILHFYDYYQYFEDLEGYDKITFIKSKNLARMLGVLLMVTKYISPKILSRVGIIYEKSIFTKGGKNGNILIVDSWSHKKTDDFTLTSEVRNVFRPEKQYIDKVEGAFQARSNVFDKIIGVHIRRGDYKTYKNGAYFFSDVEYLDFLNKLKSQFSKDLKVGFLLCSNEPVDTSVFQNLDVFQIPKGNLIEDLYALSRCDYIIGPPSTYSMWASFYGEKPLLFLKKSSVDVKLDDFSEIVAQDKFQDGTVFRH